MEKNTKPYPVQPGAQNSEAPMLQYNENRTTSQVPQLFQNPLEAAKRGLENALARGNPHQQVIEKTIGAIEKVQVFGEQAKEEMKNQLTKGKAGLQASVDRGSPHAGILQKAIGAIEKVQGTQKRQESYDLQGPAGPSGSFHPVVPETTASAPPDDPPPPYTEKDLHITFTQ
ncbi:unnamed protein product, partial [Mesorhabditis spiculigera]